MVLDWVKSGLGVPQQSLWITSLQSGIPITYNHTPYEHVACPQFMWYNHCKFKKGFLLEYVSEEREYGYKLKFNKKYGLLRLKQALNKYFLNVFELQKGVVASTPPNVLALLSVVRNCEWDMAAPTEMLLTSSPYIQLRSHDMFSWPWGEVMCVTSGWGTLRNSLAVSPHFLSSSTNWMQNTPRPWWAGVADLQYGGTWVPEPPCGRKPVANQRYPLWLLPE